MAKLDLHPGQSEIFCDLFVDKTVRHAVAACSRGWGKSYFGTACASVAVDELVKMDASIPNKNVAIVAPTFSQGMDIYMPLLKYQFGFEARATKIIQDEGKFILPNSTILKIWSFEAIERMRGTGQYFVLNDELCSWTSKPGIQGAWEDIIEPCMTTRWSNQMATMYGAPSAARSLNISTVKGYDYFYDMFNRHEQDDQWASYRFDYKMSPYLDIEEIERKRETMDPLTFAREYLATFEESGNNVFYRFKRDLHVVNDIPPVEAWEDIHVAIDFNVGIQASSFFVIRGDQLHFFDEMSGHPDTDQLAQAIVGRYSGTWTDRHGNEHDRNIYAYPDPSGKSRKTSAAVGVTDLAILRTYGIKLRATESAPPIVDSVSSVNSKLQSASGRVGMYIHAKCKGLITSLERTVWLDNNPNTATISKKEKVEHFSDGIRYAVDWLFPVISKKINVKKGTRY
jgi:hypothetical protein